MSTKWKATPNKFWCKHCKIFVRDSPLERTQHEASPRHQGNLKRFLGSIHKNQQIAEREKLQAKSEVARLEGVVTGKRLAPVPIQGANAPSSSSRPLQRTSRNAAAREEPQRAATREDRKRQLEQLIALGVAIPDELRSELAHAGDWVTTKVTKLDEEEGEDEKKEDKKDLKVEDVEENEDGVGAQDYRSGFKRKRATDLDNELDEANNNTKRGWGKTFKEYPGSNVDKADELDELFSRAKKAAIKKDDGIRFAPVDSEDADGKGDGEEEEAHEPVTQPDPPEVTEPTDEGVVFKKRKPKPLRQK